MFLKHNTNVYRILGYIVFKEYFDYVFARIPNFKRENSLIIGDTLGSDILGGKNVGMDTCWFNPTNKSNTGEIVPTYQIAELEKLYDILN